MDVEQEVIAQRRPVRIKLVNHRTKKIAGHWYLVWEGAGWRLTTWRNGKERPEPVRGTDPQAAVDIMMIHMEENLREFIDLYKNAIGKIQGAIERKLPARQGFRPKHTEKIRTQVVNVYTKITSNYVREAGIHLSTLPTFGWPACSRLPFSKMDIPHLDYSGGST